MPTATIGISSTSTRGGGSGTASSTNVGSTPVPLPSTTLDVGSVEESIQRVNDQIDTIIDDAQQFTDAEILAQPFVDAFDKFSSTAQEVLLQEVRVAEDDLRAFQNNNPDVRAAVNLGVSRDIKSQIFNATLESSNTVFKELAAGIFQSQQLASQNFSNISNILATSTTQLAGITADFVASLSSTQASIYTANLNHAANLAQISANRDIAELQNETTRRGQDIQLEISELDAANRIELAELSTNPGVSPRSPSPIQGPSVPRPPSGAQPPADSGPTGIRTIGRFSPTGIPLSTPSGLQAQSPYQVY